MARKKQELAETNDQAQAQAVISSNETITEEEITMEENKMARANRVAVSVVEGGGFKADFYKTHKKVASISSNETGWIAKADMNKSAQREDFRLFIVEHAADIGIAWQPEDMRADTNRRIAKYTTDAELGADAIDLIGDDITAFVVKCPHEISIENISIDSITPTTISGKGTDLSKLGIENGKYLKSGNWAWATIGICITLKAQMQEIYVSLDVQLVSGQLKKPSHIGSLGYTQTAWNTAIKAELISAGIIKEEEEK